MTWTPDGHHPLVAVRLLECPAGILSGRRTNRLLVLDASVAPGDEPHIPVELVVLPAKPWLKL